MTLLEAIDTIEVQLRSLNGILKRTSTESTAYKIAEKWTNSLLIAQELMKAAQLQTTLKDIDKSVSGDKVTNVVNDINDQAARAAKGVSSEDLI